jgi:hypothetical protein
MAPEWWIEAQTYAEENYDPSENDGKEWDQLSSEEQEKGILEAYENMYVGGT